MNFNSNQIGKFNYEFSIQHNRFILKYLYVSVRLPNKKIKSIN